MTSQPGDVETYKIKVNILNYDIYIFLNLLKILKPTEMLDIVSEFNKFVFIVI